MDLQTDAQTPTHPHLDLAVDAVAELGPELEGAPDESTNHGLRDRRREKPQLSCTFCRRRKVRCDRQLPCKTCIGKGIALSCTYAPGPQSSGKGASVGERIQQLEALVRSMVQQHPAQTPSTFPVGPLAESPPHSIEVSQGELPESVASGPHAITPRSSIIDDADPAPAAASSFMHGSFSSSKDREASPAFSEHGRMRMHSHGSNYVSNVHWAAVLDSISELKDHYEKEEEARILATSDYAPQYGIGPRLLYEPVQATKSEILATLPARPAVDRMVARYFNAQGVAPAVLHSDQFLREYEKFWQNPDIASFGFIGLLFSIICLSAQYQQLTEDPADPETKVRVHVFRERTVQCLVLSQFTRGGPYVLETLINHCSSEGFLCKDADTGLWLLLGLLVQLALSLGYHRDPRNFPDISPFTGEMRRRVWSTIVQMDLRLSSQMGLPRLLNSRQCDTGEPRNLLDSDFDETATELPPSRPETEVTPVLYGLAKNRIDSISGLISDLIADTREHPYSEIMDLDRKLLAAQASLPPIFRWQPLSQSFIVPPQIVLHRIWLQLAVQRLIIWLHRKYLAPSHAEPHFKYSRDVCVQAAIKILEFQQLVDEETQPHGLLYPVRWMLSSLMQSIFLLGMSVLCYYMQLAKTTPDISLDRELGTRIQELLSTTYPLWLRSSTVSQDARKAVEHLSLLPGLGRDHADSLTTQEGPSRLSLSQDAATFSLDQVTWDAYQECMANFPITLGADFMVIDPTGPVSGVRAPFEDPLLSNTTELDRWFESEVDLPPKSRK